ncbi:hypothetical protein N7532_002271 [Penicillium argentinense]|uniref:Uncharacterized protein n=1 Tax=Penicillium argentinense TaxID=1131581 RepID=A0A9W9G053_9EURO|nr:uncharacterized protein N7532_002271 [Penicillium argentinense]KAJ5109626.1 hypothetical protein N7532_002271 [Penicillium argentinense]
MQEHLPNAAGSSRDEARSSDLHLQSTLYTTGTGTPLCTTPTPYTVYQHASHLSKSTPDQTPVAFGFAAGAESGGCTPSACKNVARKLRQPQPHTELIQELATATRPDLWVRLQSHRPSPSVRNREITNITAHRLLD